MTKKILLIMILLVSYTAANDFNDLKTMFLKKQYAKVCSKSVVLYPHHKHNSNFLNIFAVSCLNSDMINKLMVPIIKLYKTKADRENAAYYATILYKKKLLYYALIDHIDISYVRLPKTNYILSNIFDKYVQKKYRFKGNSYWFDDDHDTTLKYQLSIEEVRQVKKMYLRTYKDGILIKTRTYW
ncbi:hypothetical protein [Sulfurospirillum sp. 1612]|uniref:hypothetical protein n=1 Tax=Sulfurospirillum sp. 1612 TaxID=3094835 RepID=UPI002F934E4F